jgi:DNA-binding transcriptional regulator/RsmH inhibitor MraZ
MSAMNPGATRSIKLDKGRLRIPAAFREPLRGANHPIDRQWRVRLPRQLLKFVHGIPQSAALPSGEPRTVLLCRPAPIP